MTLNHKEEAVYLRQHHMKQLIGQDKNVYLLKKRILDTIFHMEKDLIKVFIFLFLVKTLEVGPGSYDDKTIGVDG